MTTLAAAMPHIVDQVDRGKAGWDTKARLLTVVAWRTSTPGSWTWIDRAVLAEHQRDGWEARWDLKVLEELAGPRYRILRRAPGAPLWRLAGDDLDAILRWRHVPWIGGRRAALAAVRRCVGVAQVAVGAGQTVFPVAVDTRFGHLGDLDLSVKQPPTAPHQPPTAPHPDAATSTNVAPTATCATVDDDASPLSGLLRNPSVSSARTDGPTEELRSLVNGLAQVCFEVSGDPITGAPLRRLERIAAGQLAHADELRAFAGTLKERGFRRWGGVLDALEAWRPADAPPPRPACGDCGALLASDGFCCGRTW